MPPGKQLPINMT